MSARDRFHHRAGGSTPRRHLWITLLLSIPVAAVSIAQEQPQPAGNAIATEAPAGAVQDAAGELERARAEVVRLGSEHREVTAKLDEAKAELAALRTNREELQQQLAEVETRLRAAQTASAQTQQRLESQGREMQEKLDAAQAETAASRTSRDELQRQLTQLQQQSDKAETASAETRQRLEAATQETERLKGELAQAQAQATQLGSQGQAIQAQLDTALAEAVALRSGRDQLRQQQAALEQQLRQSETAMAETRQRLDAALVAVTRLKADLEGKLEQARVEALGLQSEKQKLRAELDRAKAQATQLQASRDELRQRLLETNAALNGAEAARTETAGRLNASVLEAQRLEQDLARTHQVNSALESRLAAMQRALDEREEEVAAILGRLPTPEGGSVTVDEAKAAASADGQALVEARRAAFRSSNPESRTALREAEGRLHRSQLLVARSLNARSVYRVRSSDTLALVSQKFYGNGNLWSRIFEANSHILANPDRLILGMTLVIP